MSELPTGTITFLFTDIEGSSQHWEQQPDAMRLALARHDACLRAAIEGHHGNVFKAIGDQFCAVFSQASAALAAALAAQQSLRGPAGTPAREARPEIEGQSVPLRVRMALHSGTAESREGDYFGPTLNRVARLLAVAHGGQVLLSRTTYDLVQDELPPGVSLRDLGLHRLRDLQRPEQIYQLVHPDLPAEFPPIRSLNLLPNNIPQQTTSFVGREREMSEVKRLLSTPTHAGGAGTRLLTLTGPGGTGKTRLSLEVAAELPEEYPDGVWLVELAALTDPALVPQAVAREVNVREEPGQPLVQTLVERLKPKTLLLVLDNCEHLLPACSALVEALLRGCPTVQILATSREGLNIRGEQTYQVPPLSSPDPRNLPPTLESLAEFEAVRLFLDRAVLVQPAFAITPRNARALAQVCHQLEGIPLLIELAAARLKVLSMDQIARRLDDRFRLLTGGSRTALPRHQTIRALIDWSYDLLSESEQRLLRRLSVFAGGFTLDAAEAICPGEGIEPPAVLDLLGQLVDKSMVLAEEETEERRYRVMETIRQYAAEKLRESGEEAILRARHREWFLALAEKALPQLLRPGQVVWRLRMIEEYENLRAALSEVKEREETTPDSSRLARWGQVIETLAPTYRGEAGRVVLEDYLALCQACDYQEGLLRGYTLMGQYFFFNPDLARDADSSLPMFEQAIAVGEAHGLRDWTVYPRSHLAYSLASYGTDLERAEALARACLPQAQALQDPRLLQRLYTCLMWVAAHRSDWAAMKEAFDASLPYGGPVHLAILALLVRIEETCHRQDQDALFRDLCDHLVEGYHRAGLPLPLQQFYLEPTIARDLPGEPSLEEEWERKSKHPALQWQDPTGQTRTDRTTRPSWLGIYPPKDCDLWPQQNFDAPRLLATVRGEYVAQTRVELGQNTCVLAGLLLWRDSRHYVRLEIQRRSRRWMAASVQLEACVAGQFQIIGRGRWEQPPGHQEVGGWLRLERLGDEVRGLCSIDGHEWFTCGSVRFSPGETEQVGVAAIWQEPNAHAWFDTLLLWGGTGP